MVRTLNIFSVMVLITTQFVSGSLAGAESGEVETTHIVMVNVGGVDNALFQRAVDYVDTYLSTTVQVIDARESAGGETLDQESATLQTLLKPDSFCIVGLVIPEADIEKPFMMADTEIRVGLVNARGLKPADGDMEKYGRRLEKETMAAIGLIAGLTPSIVPDCATHHYTTIEKLDLKGRNFSPPQLLRFQKFAVEAKLAGHGDTASKAVPASPAPAPADRP